MDAFSNKKKVDNNRIFSYIFSIIILFLYWKYYSPIGTFVALFRKVVALHLYSCYCLLDKQLFI